MCGEGSPRPSRGSVSQLPGSWAVRKLWEAASRHARALFDWFWLTIQQILFLNFSILGNTLRRVEGSASLASCRKKLVRFIDSVLITSFRFLTS